MLSSKKAHSVAVSQKLIEKDWAPDRAIWIRREVRIIQQWRNRGVLRM